MQQLAQSEKTARQTIYAYLIQPVQRIPRYRLLLADMLKHTPTSHKDWKNLEQAHNLVGETATLVNTKTAEAERTLKVPSRPAAYACGFTHLKLVWYSCPLGDGDTGPSTQLHRGTSMA